MARPARQLGEEVGQRLGGALHPRRHDAGCDYGGLQQSQIIACEVENFGDGGDFGSGLEIHAGQPENRLVDHAKVGFHRRFGIGRTALAADAQIDRHVEHARAFGEIHAQEKDVAPRAVGEVHAHRRGLEQDRKERLGGVASQEFRADAQRIVRRMADPEHPLVAANRADTAAHLVRQRLERQCAIAGGEGAGYGGARAGGLLGCQEEIDGLLEAALQQCGVTGERDLRPRSGRLPKRDVIAVDGVQKQQGPHALVEVVAGAAKAVQGVTLGRQFFEGGVAAKGIERAVSGFEIGRRYHAGERAHRSPPPEGAAIWRSTSSSTIWDKTWLRSCPFRARANCATSSP